MSAPSNTWANAIKIKELSKLLQYGPECKMTCRMLKTEAKLGRSKVLDLNV
jgi:hypothetical protein